MTDEVLGIRLELETLKRQIADMKMEAQVDHVETLSLRRNTTERLEKIESAMAQISPTQELSTRVVNLESAVCTEETARLSQVALLVCQVNTLEVKLQEANRQLKTLLNPPIYHEPVTPAIQDGSAGAWS